MKSSLFTADQSTKKIAQLMEKMKGAVRKDHELKMEANDVCVKEMEKQRFSKIKNSLVEWLEKLRALSLNLPFWDSENNEIGAWSEFIPPALISDIRQASNKEAMREAIMLHALDAHQLMLLSFLDQVSEVEKHFDQFEQRYFGHYIGAIVNMQPHSTIAEKVHIAVESIDGRESIIPIHQQFTAETKEGDTLSYQTQDDSFINACHLDHISIVSNTVNCIQGVFHKTYTASDACNPYLDPPVALNDLRWEDNDGKLIIETSALMLKSGDRKIHLTFIDQGRAVVSEILSILQSVISVFVMSENEWMRIEPISEEESEGLLCWYVKEGGVQIVLPDDAFACDRKIALSLNVEALSYLNTEQLSQTRRAVSTFSFDQVRVAIDVDQYTLAIAKNQNGEYALDAPFFPFLSPIKKRSGFDIDLASISPIGLKTIFMKVNWNNLPEFGLQDYYQVYSNYHNRQKSLADPDDDQIITIDENSFHLNWSFQLADSKSRVCSLGDGRVRLFDYNSDSIEWALSPVVENETKRLQKGSDCRFSLRFSLSEESHFQHSYYTRIQQAQLQKQSSSSSSILTSGSSDGFSERVLNTPYEPEIDNIDIRYASEVLLDVVAEKGYREKPRSSSNNINGVHFDLPESLKMLAKVDTLAAVNENTAVGLRPSLNREAFLTLAFDQLSLGNCLNVYFNIHRPGHCSSTQEHSANWLVWTTDGWEAAKILFDETNNLSATGIIGFWLPSHADLQDGFYRLVFCGSRNALSARVQSILVNAVTLTLDTHKHPSHRWQQALPEYSVNQVKNNDHIAAVYQPYAGFSGRSAESIQERNIHFGLITQYKSRFNKLGSYERQLLHRFNDVLMVKCFPESIAMSAGNLEVLILPRPAQHVKVQELEAGHQVTLPAYLEDDIVKYLTPRVPLGVVPKIETPRIQKKRYAIALVRDIEAAENFEFYSDLIRSHLKEILTPFSRFYRENIGLSPYIANTLIRRELENLSYVDRVTTLNVWRTEQEQGDQSLRENLRYLYTFDEASEICWVDAKGAYIAGDEIPLELKVDTRIGESIIGEDFVLL